MFTYLAIFFFELLWSIVSNEVNKSVIKRKPLKAGLYGLASASMASIVPIYVFLYTENWLYFIPAILGDAAGDYYAAKKRKQKKINPFNLANI